MNTVRFAAISLTLYIASHSTLAAQDPFGNEPSADPFGVSEASAPAIVKRAEANGDEAKAEDTAKEDPRKKERLDAIGSISFDRRPSAILKLWSERGKNPIALEVVYPEPPSNKPVQETPKAAVAGDPSATTKSLSGKCYCCKQWI